MREHLSFTIKWMTWKIRSLLNKWTNARRTTTTRQQEKNVIHFCLFYSDNNRNQDEKMYFDLGETGKKAKATKWNSYRFDGIFQWKKCIQMQPISVPSLSSLHFDVSTWLVPFWFLKCKKKIVSAKKRWIYCEFWLLFALNVKSKNLRFRVRSTRKNTLLLSIQIAWWSKRTLLNDTNK